MTQAFSRISQRVTSLLVLFALFFSTWPIPAAGAAGIRYAKPAASGAGTCSSWANACTLQTALTGATTGDEIWAGAGVHKPTTGNDRSVSFQLKSGVEIYGGFAMTETLRSQRNPATNVTVLSGDIDNNDLTDPHGVVTSSVNITGTNAYHVVTGSGVTTTAVLDGFTVTGGNATSTSAPNNMGGGLYANNGSPTLTNVTFSGNAARDAGGGMVNFNGSPTLTNITFHGNSVQVNGGGLYNAVGSPALTNVTFSSNTASNSGGGMFIGLSSPTLTNVTFSGNSAANYGGGVYNFDNSNPMIRNTILWGNTAMTGTQISNLNSTPVVSYSVVQGGCPTGSTCTNIITADPRLGALGNYGGSTLTVPLLPGSSAINAGNDTVCPSTDQRGVMRPQSTHCDIGAFEYEYAVGVHYASPTAVGAGDCSSWANACDLQTALTWAVPGDEIWVGTGVHKPTTGSNRTVSFQLKSGVGVYGGFVMTETLRSQRNITANVTVLSGDIDSNDLTDPHGVVTTTTNITGTNAYHVVTASGVTPTAVLDGFTVTAGNANSLSAPNDSGGGMYNSGGSPTLTNVTFSGNAATFGGGMFNGLSAPTLTNVTFSGNSASSQGGGMYNGQGSPALTNVTFSGNSAQDGSGMFNGLSAPTLTNVTFSGNAATRYGGGMENWNSNPTLTGVTFSGNSASSQGGGMYNDSSSPTLTNVTFSGNSANYGGGMYNYNSSSPTLTNVTFSGNSATGTYGCGGGMENNWFSSPTLTNVTFSGNAARNAGGGMFNYHGSSPTIRNTILWGNTAASNGAQVYNYDSSTPAISDSVVQGGCPADSTCANVITTDPRLGALGNYGGPSTGSGQATLTFALLPGSSAINAGDDTVCPSIDERGVARPQGARCDIGAFESRGFTLTKTGDHQTTLMYIAFAQSLSVTLSETGGSGLAGVALTFTAPFSGASAYLSTPTATTDSSGSASVTATANGILGSYPVTVMVSGIITPVTFVLANTANTLVAVSASPNPSTFGQTVTFTATVSVAAPGSGTPSGGVAFKADGSVIPGCGAQALNGSGQATCATAVLAVGPHSLSAEYGGNGIYNPSAAAYPQTVNPAPAATTITSSANPSVAGSPVTFTVMVTAPYGIPTGTVEFYETTSPAASLSAQALTARPLVNGTATFTAASLSAGTHTMMALYSGDANFTPSISAQYAQVVSAQPLVTLTINYAGNGSGTVLRSPNAINYTAGTVVTLTAVPAAGSVFAGWGGASDCADGIVTLDANKACTATFTLNTYTLTVTTAGSGSVIISPDQVSYTAGTVVTLTAVPAPGSVFAGWSGAVVSTTNPLVLTMDAAKSVTATFVTDQAIHRVFLPMLLKP